MKLALRLLIGALGGGSATGPMTSAMVALHRRLPLAEKYPLPPREITGQIARGLHVDGKLSEEASTALTLLNHFAYGSACGAVYAGVAERWRAPFFIKGVAFGLLVWVFSYFGLLPMAGALKSAERHPWRRNLLMAAVHAIWGVLTAAFVESARTERRRPAAALADWSPLGHRDAR